MSQKLFLILHGWGGNKPAHWQEHLAARLADAGAAVHAPKMPDPGAPDLEAWVARLTAEMQEIQANSRGELPTVLAHSLGSITWLHYTARLGTNAGRVADRVLLVAPPYIVPQIPPIDVPPSVTAFFPPPVAPAALRSAVGETVLIASDTDDYSTFDQSSGLAQLLEIPIHKLAGAGHISPYYGYGEWPWALEWCLGESELPPRPRDTEKENYRNMAFVKVMNAADLAPGSGTVVVTGPHELAIFNVDGEFFCTENTCPHQDGPLGDGRLEGDVIICPWHGWEFNVRTGKSLYSGSICVGHYPCRVENGEVLVDPIPAPAE